jgi:hypothetical protein
MPIPQCERLKKKERNTDENYERKTKKKTGGKLQS